MVAIVFRNKKTARRPDQRLNLSTFLTDTLRDYIVDPMKRFD
jgi:hypothetical protein